MDEEHEEPSEPAQQEQAGETKEGGELPETRGKFGPKKAGEFERRREWRCDQGTLERFRRLIKEFVGTQ